MWNLTPCFLMMSPRFHARIICAFRRNFGLLWHQQLIVASSAERHQGEPDTESTFKGLSFYRNIWGNYVESEIKVCMPCRDEMFMRSHECLFGAYFPRCPAKSKKNISWTRKQLFIRVHTLFYISVNVLMKVFAYKKIIIYIRMITTHLVEKFIEGRHNRIIAWREMSGYHFIQISYLYVFIWAANDISNVDEYAIEQVKF